MRQTAPLRLGYDGGAGWQAAAQRWNSFSHRPPQLSIYPRPSGPRTILKTRLKPDHIARSRSPGRHKPKRGPMTPSDGHDSRDYGRWSRSEGFAALLNGSQFRVRGRMAPLVMPQGKMKRRQGGHADFPLLLLATRPALSTIRAK